MSKLKLTCLHEDECISYGSKCSTCRFSKRKDFYQPIFKYDGIIPPQRYVSPEGIFRWFV